MSLEGKVAITPGWLRSEMMLDAYGVTEAHWRDATAKQPHFAISETPRYVGRAVAAWRPIRTARAGTGSRCPAVNWPGPAQRLPH